MRQISPIKPAQARGISSVGLARADQILSNPQLTTEVNLEIASPIECVIVTVLEMVVT